MENTNAPSCDLDTFSASGQETAIETEYYFFAVDAESGRFGLKGDWTIGTISKLEGVIEELELKKMPINSFEFHCGGLQRFDLSGAWLLYRTAERLRAAGFETSFSGFRAEHLQFIDDVLNIEKPHKSREKPVPALVQAWRILQAYGVDMLNEISMRYLWFLSISARLVATVLDPRRFRLISTARHIHDVGIKAIGIVAMMAFLVALVLGFQGQNQLVQFGAQIYTIDLVSISVLREMGGLLTAILVAGRSGSAFAAEIGVMQLNEEVDAMQTMGIDPYETLIIPRMTALLICLPLLTFIADIAGLIGIFLLATVTLDIPGNLVVERFLALEPMDHFMVGMIKAPFFALVIGMIGTYRGYYVASSADAVGRNTTNAVVESIFLVMVVDALFSIIFTKLGI
ncbi:MAG: ABC transporter permease [Gammaproteobacteria bacterium]|nr:ABC transporter permease [Gammaproteobacteria bacterium]